MLDKLKPAAGRVVVLPDAAADKTQSGIFIPEIGKQPPSSGVVTHVAEGDTLYKVGDHVLFVKNAGVELTSTPVHFLMREDDIYATI